MTAYNVLDRTALVSGQPEDVSKVLENFDAIATVLNGSLDNANLKAAANLAISKLAGYPTDATKALFGDGTWKVPTISPPVYSKTTLPASASDGTPALFSDVLGGVRVEQAMVYSVAAGGWNRRDTGDNAPYGTALGWGGISVAGTSGWVLLTTADSGGSNWSWAPGLAGTWEFCFFGTVYNGSGVNGQVQMGVSLASGTSPVAGQSFSQSVGAAGSRKFDSRGTLIPVTMAASDTAWFWRWYLTADTWTNAGPVVGVRPKQLIGIA